MRALGLTKTYRYIGALEFGVDTERDPDRTNVTGPTLRLELPFVERGDVSLKKIGPELIVKVDGHKRTIMLPPALDRWRPDEARLADGTLVVKFREPSSELPAAAQGARGG